MRDPNRIDEVLYEISSFWKINPDLRLCQLLQMAANYSGINSTDPFYVENSTDLFYVEEEELVNGIRKLRELIHDRENARYTGIKKF